MAEVSIPISQETLCTATNLTPPALKTRGPPPRPTRRPLGLLRERVPDLSSFWAPAIEYQLLRKADVPVGEATVIVREVRSGLEVPQAGV
jgi:hypothetical protein